MAIIPIPVDDRQKEKIVFHSDMLHYGLYLPGPKGYFYGDIPWHWHDEFEFGYILGGSMLYKTPRCEYILSEGDGIFVNSGTLHYLHPQEPKNTASLCSQFIDQSFLSGALGSLIDLKYITPVLENNRLEVIPFFRQDPKSARILDQLLEAIELGRTRQPFFELRIRSLFSQIWEYVYAQAMDLKSQDNSAQVQENDRIKEMLKYMQDHYNDHLTVRQVAGCIPISERECFRLFKSCLGISPMEYLTAFRLQKARELLMNTQKSILDITLETGFCSSSYFGKVFRQHYNITPIQYRNMCRHQKA